MKLYFNYHQQLVRVDNIKEFHPLLFDRKITDFFVSQKFLISRGEQASPVPYKHLVPKEVFELLLSRLRQKVGFNSTLNCENWKTIRITKSSYQQPCIIIEYEDAPLNEVQLVNL